MTNTELIAESLRECEPRENMAQQAVTLKWFVRKLCDRLEAVDAEREDLRSQLTELKDCARENGLWEAAE